VPIDEGGYTAVERLIDGGQKASSMFLLESLMLPQPYLSAI
jgi:hypothetical protein